MKYINQIFILLFLFASPCMAKIKVVEKSAKKAPIWLNTTQKDYIITSAVSNNPEKAKNECMDNIRKYIIDAVAQNVKSTSESTINQESVNNGIVNFLDKYTYSAKTQSANVPYLTGISESKIEDSYWEKRQDTETKQITYLYSVKYPFPSLELKKLVHEFRQQDEEMNNNYKKLEEQYEIIESVEQIDKAITDLNPLIHYFFDDIRKEAAKNLQNNYRQLYNQIVYKEISNKPGCYTFQLTLREQPISISQRPVLKSETLTQLRGEQTNKEWKIFYNYETCDPAEENFASITFRPGGKLLSQKFYIDLNQNCIQLFPSKEVYLTAAEKNDSLVSNLSVRMNIEARGNYTITGLTLNVPGLSKPLFADDLNIHIQNGNNQTIIISYPESIELLQKQNYRRNILKGYMEVKNEENANKRVDFSLPFKTNW